MTGVALRRGAGVQSHSLGAHLGGDAACIEMCVVLVVDTDAEFHGHRDVGALRGLDSSGDDVAEEAALIRQC